MEPEDYRVVYQQYWLHARHIEDQRQWFTNIYAAVVVGALVYSGNIGIGNIFTTYILIFLTLLSVLGYILAIIWSIPSTKFARLAEKIAICEWGLPEQYQRFTNYGKPISTTTLIMIFYSLMIGIFGMLSLNSILQRLAIESPMWLSMISLITIISIFVLIYIFYLEPSTIGKIHKEFGLSVEKYQEK